MTIFDDLEAEEERIEAVLATLDDAGWQHASGAAGWSVADVVLHLAQTEEAVLGSVDTGSFVQREDGRFSIDDWAEQAVRSGRGDPQAAFERWKAARRRVLDKLRTAAPGETIEWAVVPLKPRSLATTRLAEHWTHGLDITGTLGVHFPDTARLHQIAWLGHRSLPYGFSVLGKPSHDVFCDLEGPEGESWQFGDPDAESTISGLAGAFCRVGARRLKPEDSGLRTAGPYGEDALHALRNYAA